MLRMRRQGQVTAAQVPSYSFRATELLEFLEHDPDAALHLIARIEDDLTGARPGQGRLAMVSATRMVTPRMCGTCYSLRKGRLVRKEIEKAVKQALRRAFLDGERAPGADDLATALREAEPIRRSHAERLDQARRSLRGLEKPTIRRDRGSSSTSATLELGVRLFDLN